MMLRRLLQWSRGTTPRRTSMTTAQWWCVGVASMEPWHNATENTPTGKCGAPRSPLQWSRGTTPRRTTRPGLVRLRRSLASMEPWHNATENLQIARWQLIRGSVCFNGAVAQRHGELNGRRVSFDARVASMEPWHNATENLRCPNEHRAHTRRRFNGAVAQRHGEQPEQKTVLPQ